MRERLGLGSEADNSVLSPANNTHSFISGGGTMQQQHTSSMNRPASATKMTDSKMDQYAESHGTTSPNHERLKHLCNKLAGLN